ncbi:MAG: restriction endonuclease subunit S [Anaerolineaceae bacterium]|nr:restriction endonuclease subunit S [Anaerolineaceae bacterium]
MALTKSRLGEYIELREETNDDLLYGVEDVRGVNNLKFLMPTKADINGRDLTKFQIVYPGEFVFNHRTSRNGSKFSIAYNDEDKPVICTEDYVVFRIKEDSTETLLAEWLYMYFNRPEFDRYVITNSWGSSTEFYNWEDICSVELLLPAFPVQKKYVDIYKAMVANQQSYERGLEDLKLVCDGYIEDLRRKMPREKIGKYLELVEDKNENEQFGLDSVRGVSIEKAFIETKADMTDVNLAPYYIIHPNDFAYVTVTSRNGEKISVALNDSDETYICSSSYVVFRSKDPERLFPPYLMLFFSRSEFNRYARFHSLGSARETFDWAEMCEVEIPIPDIKSQKAVAAMFSVYTDRKKINAQLKAQIKDICPILIKGSLEEGKKNA